LQSLCKRCIVLPRRRLRGLRIKLKGSPSVKGGMKVEACCCSSVRRCDTN
jgi:hypothetical protein